MTLLTGIMVMISNDFLFRSILDLQRMEPMLAPTSKVGVQAPLVCSGTCLLCLHSALRVHLGTMMKNLRLFLRPSGPDYTQPKNDFFFH